MSFDLFYVFTPYFLLPRDLSSYAATISKRHKRLTIYFQLDSTSLTASISLRLNVRTRVATGKGNEQYFFFTVKDNLKVQHFNSSTFRKECTRQIIILTS